MFSPRALLVSLLPLAAHAHMGMWHPSVLDFDGDGYTLVTPLSKLPFSDWWFHGLLSSPTPSSVFSLPAGGSVTVETACRRAYSSYGDESDGKDGCPTDIPSYHAGKPIDDSQLLGCGLAIAYKNSFSDVQPADFTVFSVNHECIKQLRTDFKLPEVMKPCPEDGCICSWFWQGQDSDDEMYMNGFRCNVTGADASATAIADPQPPKWCPNGGCVDGPKQPLYWANDNSNIEYSGNYDEKPSYNMKWGFPDGAQEIAKAGGAASTGAETTTTTAATTTRAKTTTGTKTTATSAAGGAAGTTTATHKKTTLTTVTKTVTMTSSAASSTAGECSWPGHCIGATCTTYNDCSDDLICISGKCAVEV